MQDVLHLLFLNVLVVLLRQSHVIPDAAALFDETEGARDPFFGVMETGYDLPSPSSLMQVDATQIIEDTFQKTNFTPKY